jgi:hypothetical protein
MPFFLLGVNSNFVALLQKMPSAPPFLSSVALVCGGRRTIAKAPAFHKLLAAWLIAKHS